MAGPQKKEKLKKGLKRPKNIHAFKKNIVPGLLRSAGRGVKEFISDMGDLTKFANLIKKGHSPREAASILRNKGKD